jgi:ABC-type amino acid transport substrate-binding protein
MGVQRGVVHGFGVKLEQQLNRWLKTTPETRVHVVFVPTSRDQLFDALIEGRGDIIAAGLTVTPERAQRMDFTAPSQTNVRRILVAGPGATAVRQLDDLSGMKVAVREKSLDLENLLSLNLRFQRQGKAPAATGRWTLAWKTTACSRW